MSRILTDPFIDFGEINLSSMGEIFLSVELWGTYEI